MSIKKIFGVLTVLMLIIGIFMIAGCGKDEEPEPVAPVVTPEPVTPPAPVPKPAGKVRPERRSGKRPSPMVIGCGVLVLIGLCILIGGWYYVDTYAPEYYCYFLPFLPGCP